MQQQQIKSNSNADLTKHLDINLYIAPDPSNFATLVLP